MPVPGDGRYEWDGYFDMDVLPQEFNPDRGFTGTANSMNLPAGYPIRTHRIGFEWSAPWRYRRIWEVLTQQSRHGLIDSHDLQRDYESILAREVISRLPQVAQGNEAESPSLSRALALLQNWDYVLHEDSAAAAFYAVWYYRHLGRTLATHLAPDAADLIAPLDPYTVLATLNTAQAIPPTEESLENAWQETRTLLGEDPQQWRWGDLHQAVFQHPLMHLATAELRAKMAYPPYPRGGSGNTTNNTVFRPEDFLVRAGASFRMVLDVGRWDDAEMTNTPGQSGNPNSPFYRNLLQGWAEDSSFPLLYSREAVTANQALRIELIPE
jgi:penicillin amidase